MCVQLDFLLTSFVYSLLNCEYSCSQVAPSFLAISSICSLILGYAVRIFHTTDAKYIRAVQRDPCRFT